MKHLGRLRMGEVITVIIFLVVFCGTIFGIKSCEEQDHKHVMERRAQCFDATKSPDCFGELKK